MNIQVFHIEINKMQLYKLALQWPKNQEHTFVVCCVGVVVQHINLDSQRKPTTGGFFHLIKKTRIALNTIHLFFLEEYI